MIKRVRAEQYIVQEEEQGQRKRNCAAEIEQERTRRFSQEADGLFENLNRRTLVLHVRIICQMSRSERNRTGCARAAHPHRKKSPRPAGSRASPAGSNAMLRSGQG